MGALVFDIYTHICMRQTLCIILKICIQKSRF